MRFADHGEARLNTPSGANDTAPRRLSGTGFGAKWATRPWNISVLAAWKVGEHEAQGDGARQARVWAQLAYAF
ncbi:hypothetical protein NA655_18945 [Pseudomonas kuykendallii]|uniref:hypothetical protein n=1 Tax=Pseudomonas kuykendallii TaxID=1007099 RepID=UPI000B7CA473|nr:hypothetical protein [Pseudomonas kuykendallii]MCQ4273114.1 hypothetical protein [Pseudomonas kuykendallii]